jgi:hypothetical protein
MHPMEPFHSRDPLAVGFGLGLPECQMGPGGPLMALTKDKVPTEILGSIWVDRIMVGRIARPREPRFMSILRGRKARSILLLAGALVLGIAGLWLHGSLDPWGWGVDDLRAVRAFMPVAEVKSRQMRRTLVQQANGFGEIRVSVGVLEEWIDRVHPGLPALITVDGFPEKTLSGVVADIAPLPDPIRWRNQYSVGVKIDKGFPGLRPDMRATVKLVLDGLDEVLAVPVQALAHSDGRDRVAYREADGEFTWCKVTTGVPADGFVEIVEGLQDLHGRKLVALDPQALIREQARRESPGTPDNPAQTIPPASTQESIQGKYHRVMKPASRQSPRPPAPGDR